MVQGILSSTLLAFNIATFSDIPQLSPHTSPFTGFAQVASKRVEIVWVVKDSDSLRAIAEDYYGSGDYWTTIWNDNSWIENPNAIEPGWTLKLRKQAQSEPETLKASLAGRITIAYSPPVRVVAVSMPSQTAPATQLVTKISYTSGPLNDAQITFLGNCESGMTATRNSGNGYYGAFQFSLGTWKSMGTAYERADLAPLEVQIDAVQRLLSRSSIFTQFPGCARKMRALGLI